MRGTFGEAWEKTFIYPRLVSKTWIERALRKPLTVVQTESYAIIEYFNLLTLFKLRFDQYRLFFVLIISPPERR